MDGLRRTICVVALVAIPVTLGACFSDNGDADSGGPSSSGTSTSEATTTSASGSTATSDPTGTANTGDTSGTGNIPMWEPRLLWDTTRAGLHPNSEDSARGLAIALDGSIVAAGSMNDDLGTSADIWWARYDESGNPMQETLFDVNTQVDLGLGAAAELISGDIFIVGVAAMGPPNTEPFLRRVDPVGFTSTPFGMFTPAPGVHTARAVAVSEDAVFVAGAVPDASGSEDVFVTAFDFTGAIVWSETMGGPNEDGAFGVAYHSGSARLVVVGSTSPTAGDEDALIWRLNASTGAEVDLDVFPGSAAATDQAARTVVFHDDATFYVGGSDGSDGAGLVAWVRRYNASGTAAWTETFDAPGVGDAGVGGIAVTAADEVIACGWAAGQQGDLDLWMARYDRGTGAPMGMIQADGGQGGADRFDTCIVSGDTLLLGGRVTGPNDNTDAYIAAYQP